MKKFLKILLIFIALIIAICFLIVIAIIGIKIFFEKTNEQNMYYNRGISILPDADYIVVPGAQIENNNPSLYLQHRLDYAYMLYDSNKSKKIILSGGYDNNYNKYESMVMLDYLAKLGVPKEDIIMDLHGDNTYATLKRVKEFVNDGSVIFCTQEVYAPRALYIAKNLDINMNVICSDSVIYSGRGKAFLRELFANVKAVLNCTIFPPNNVKSLAEFPFRYGEGF